MAASDHESVNALTGAIEKLIDCMSRPGDTLQKAITTTVGCLTILAMFFGGLYSVIAPMSEKLDSVVVELKEMNANVNEMARELRATDSMQDIALGKLTVEVQSIGRDVEKLKSYHSQN